MKLSNTARSISEVSSQASVYIPITLPSNPLPPYIKMDPGSQWHVSGLFSTALETMTLPSRLRSRNGQRETLDQLASAINVNGNQNIAKLQMSIINKPESEQANGTSYTVEQQDIRMRESKGHYASDHSEDLAPFDMSFFPSSDLPTGVRGPKSTKGTHIFGQVESSRGSDLSENDDARHDFDGQERGRRRAAGLAIIHK